MCQLIRQDDVQEFISYINRKNISSSQKVPLSLFGTNPFLINNQPTLIEYAAFYGSIQIFQYLQFKVRLTKQLLNYSIHGQNSDIIHLLENSENSLFGLLETIKCHHNNIANYFIDAFLLNDDLEKMKIMLMLLFIIITIHSFPKIQLIQIYFYTYVNIMIISCQIFF